MDLLSLSDPYVIVHEGFSVLGQTEILKDTLNPVFKKPIQFKYYFERVQKFVFEVRDDDGHGKFEFLGCATIILCDIVTKGLDGYEAPIILNNKQHGTIKLSAREIRNEDFNAYVRFDLRCINLEKKDLFGKSDPYLLIYKLNKDGSAENVYKTEILKKTLDPVFKVFQLPLSEVGELNIRIECWDWDRSSKDDLIGQVQFNIQDVKGKPAELQMELVNPIK